MIWLTIAATGLLACGPTAPEPDPCERFLTSAARGPHCEGGTVQGMGDLGKPIWSKCTVEACVEVVRQEPATFPHLMALPPPTKITVDFMNRPDADDEITRIHDREDGRVVSRRLLKCEILKRLDEAGIEAYVTALESAPVDDRRGAYFESRCVKVGDLGARQGWARRVSTLMVADNGDPGEIIYWMGDLRSLDAHTVDLACLDLAFNPEADRQARSDAVEMLMSLRTRGELTLTDADIAPFRARYEAAFTAEERAHPPAQYTWLDPIQPTDEQALQVYALEGRIAPK